MFDMILEGQNSEASNFELHASLLSAWPRLAKHQILTAGSIAKARNFLNDEKIWKPSNPESNPRMLTIQTA